MKIGYVFGLFLMGLSCFALAFIIQGKTISELKRSQIVYERYVLTEAKVYIQKNEQSPRVLSKVRFISWTGSPSAVYLPTADNAGFAIAYNLYDTREEGLILGSYSIANRFWLSDMSERFRDNQSPKPANLTHGCALNLEYGEKHLAWDEEFEIFEMRTVTEDDDGRPYDIKCWVTLTVEKEIPGGELKRPDRSSDSYTYNGEQLHLVNVAIPELMTAGVQLPINEE